MDKNAAMDRRFSLNMASLANPIAESTIVNLNGTTNGSLGRNSGANQFRWGSSPISPKNRSNSSICLSGSSHISPKNRSNSNSCLNSSAFYKNRSTATSPQRTRLNLSKLDPRTYADVQSRGLVSRIIQYHESGSRLNRSKSTSNICNKSGQSSMVQLQKTDLPYRATQQNVTMTRIIPPKKSIFYGNTLSSLLRSNSVISIQKCNEEISSENRPILHPPPTENELAPTRSVLDVLKEISRKRINSDESDGKHEVNKKYCSREINDTAYEQSTVPIGVRNIGLHTMNTPSILVPSQSFKRQREQIVNSSPHSQNVNSACGVTFPSTRLPLQTQHSPEQIAKKRLCSYNNDITSSLSSSLIHSNKRKFYEQQRSNMQQSPPPASEEYETQKSKMHRQQSDLRFQQLTQSLSCNTPITPIPTTPLSPNVSVTRIQNNIKNGTERLSESGGIIKRTVSEPPLVLKSQTQKPKVTLFNRNYGESAKHSQSDDKSEEKIENTVVVNDDECADIQFVKPKKSSSIVNKKNPFIERTQKSKLAMMLSGLRGEIYQGEEGYDDVDKISNKNSINTGKESNVTANKDMSIGKVITSTNSTATANTSNTTANFTMKTSEKCVTSSAAPVPLMSDFDKSRNKTTATSSSSIPNLSMSMTTTTTTSSILSGFKLSPSVTLTNNASINASPMISAANTATKTTSSLVGLKLTPQTPKPSFGNATGSSAPTFNLNTSITTTTPTASATVPQLQGFSLGPPAKTTLLTETSTTTTSISSTANTGGFTFGLAAKAEASTTVATVSTPPPFGSFGNSVTPTSKPVSSEAAKPALTFVGNAISANAAVVKPTFNFGGSITAPASTTSTTTVTSFNTAASGTYTFGGATISTTSVEPTASTAQSSSVFGSIAMNNTFNSSTEAVVKPFTFGTTATTAQSTPSTTATPAFSFGGATVPTANAGPPKATANNLFAFGDQKSTAVTTTPATTFAFGGNKTASATTSGTTSTNGNGNKPSFSFGPNEQTAVKSLSGVTNTTTSNCNLFAFGGSTTTSENKVFGTTAAVAHNLQAAATNSIQTSAFTFGAAADQGATSTFGAISGAASSKSAFGTTTTATSTPFTFGGNNSNKSTPISSPGVANKAPAGGFSFGASTSGPNNGDNTHCTNIFGAPTPTGATSVAKPAFNFGGATGTSESAKSLFGSSATNPNDNNTFGALAGANSNQTNKTFNFGGANTSNNNSSSNLFSAPGHKSGAGGFSFGTSTMGNKPATSTNSTPFAFGGGSTNGSATASAAPFSFGNSSGSAPTNKTFAFGSTNNAPAASTANANSIFGGAQQTSPATFSFSAGTSAQASPSTVANIFAPPPAPAGAGTIGGGAATTDRPIRRATRRLQKT